MNTSVKISLDCIDPHGDSRLIEEWDTISDKTQIPLSKAFLKDQYEDLGYQVLNVYVEEQ